MRRVPDRLRHDSHVPDGGVEAHEAVYCPIADDQGINGRQ